MSQFPVGQGLFFAGQSHVHIQIAASPTETGLITTNPDQVKQIEQQGAIDQPQGTIDLNNRLTLQEYELKIKKQLNMKQAEARNGSSAFGFLSSILSSQMSSRRLHG